MRNNFPKRASGCNLSKLYDVPIDCVTPPPPHLRQCISLYTVAEGWLSLDIGWFVLFSRWFSMWLYILPSKNLNWTRHLNRGYAYKEIYSAKKRFSPDDHTRISPLIFSKRFYKEHQRNCQSVLTIIKGGCCSISDDFNCLVLHWIPCGEI